MNPESGAILYSVTATLPDQTTADDYLEWLLSGHMTAVLHGGARSARATVAIDPRQPPRVEAAYVFANYGDYETYIADAAPRLRAEGLAKFGSRGVVFERRVQRIVTEASLPRPTFRITGRVWPT